jgi:uncharacterized membrane protein
MDDEGTGKPGAPREFNASEIGALAHLYRGEVYRSTSWRSRLDQTTNWSVVTLGIALSLTFSSRDASPLPLILVGILILVFLGFEARRYRYFNVWRARARWIEKNFYVPLLRREGLDLADGWTEVLAKDYFEPSPHISLSCALGRRLRRTYAWILAIQALAYCGKIAVHPTAMASLADLLQRAEIGPVPGAVVLLGGLVFNAGWILFALITLHADRTRHRQHPSRMTMG